MLTDLRNLTPFVVGTDPQSSEYQTISSALGKNERDKTLSKKGKLLVKILDFLDKNHCQNSIKEF